jgi:hypothetical protein
MITLDSYLMGRDKDFPLDMIQARNAADLLSRVNWLLAHLGIEGNVSSGYRPSAINKTIGGAKMSTHTVCAGIDLQGNELAKILIKRQDLLEKCGLYLEHPDYTPNWTHLDTKKRKNLVFIP